MSACEPSAAIAAAVEAVCRATRELAVGATQGDAGAIERAVARRGQAVEAFVGLIGGASLDADVRQALRERLVLDGEQAAEALRRAGRDTRRMLQSLATTSRAVRGYAAHSGESAALDRSR
jgi:hypothetical protein